MTGSITFHKIPPADAMIRRICLRSKVDSGSGSRPARKPAAKKGRPHRLGISPASIGIVGPRYTLVRPIVGFCPATRAVMTIPAGATITLDATKAPVGACPARWDGQEVYVCLEDVQDCAVALG